MCVSDENYTKTYYAYIEDAFDAGLKELFEDSNNLYFRVGAEIHQPGFITENEMFKTFYPESEILEKSQISHRPDFQPIKFLVKNRNITEFFINRSGLLMPINPEVAIFLNEAGEQVYPVKKPYIDVLNIVSKHMVKSF